MAVVAMQSTALLPHPAAHRMMVAGWSAELMIFHFNA
jgi:hypothetical protein